VDALSTAHVVVDGMNVIGSRPDGWWRDRDGAAQRLLGRLQGLAATRHGEVTLVLDGRAPDALPEGTYDGVSVVYARRRGRDAGDDRLVELVDALAEPRTVLVVTSDRGLATRVQALGAEVQGAGSFLEQLARIER
jgi:predicted RNA-binding protein with PIN domain